MCGGVLRKEYIIVQAVSVYVHIFIDLVKCSVLTLVTEIPRFINDHYYYYKNSYHTDSFARSEQANTDSAPSENFQFSHTHIQ